MKKLLLVLLLAAGGLEASVNPRPCDTKTFRQFDFWIGEWNVYQNGKLAGTSSIQLILDSCVIFENWTGVSGYSGKSFNLFNQVAGKWEQIWADNSGGLLKLSGDFQEGKLVLTGATPQKDGSTLQEKLTFEPLPRGEVRQHWMQSKDNGATWTTVFDGIYKRKEK